MLLIYNADNLTQEGKKLPLNDIEFYHIDESLNDIRKGNLVLLLMNNMIKVLKNKYIQYSAGNIYSSEHLYHILDYYITERNARS